MYGFGFFQFPGQNWHWAAVEERDMWLAASQVIWLRSWQLMTGTMSAVEAARMVLEKPLAFAEAAREAGRTSVSGGDPGAIARAAIRPLSREARRNAQRLRG